MKPNKLKTAEEARRMTKQTYTRVEMELINRIVEAVNEAATNLKYNTCVYLTSYELVIKDNIISMLKEVGYNIEANNSDGHFKINLDWKE